LNRQVTRKRGELVAMQVLHGIANPVGDSTLRFYPPISTERGESMKLLFTRNDVHKGCLKTTWDAEDRKISWITLFLTDFYHGAPRDLSEYEVTRTLFDEFSKACVKEQSKIYACLEFPFESDYKTCVDELRTSGKVFLTGRDIAARKGKLWGLIKSGAKSRSILVSEAKWQNISHWYRSYEDWTVTCYKFLISDTPLSDWVQDLLTIRNRGLDVEFLARVDKILVNHFEHGIEVVGLDLSPDPFEDVARILSRKLNLSLDIQDSPKNRSH